TSGSIKRASNNRRRRRGGESRCQRWGISDPESPPRPSINIAPLALIRYAAARRSYPLIAQIGKSGRISHLWRSLNRKEWCAGRPLTACPLLQFGHETKEVTK